MSGTFVSRQSGVKMGQGNSGKVPSRRAFLTALTYVAPAILTLQARPAFAQLGSGTPNKPKKPKGNNGVGNGEDPQPPGNPPINDGPGTGPGNPGNQGGSGGKKDTVNTGSGGNSGSGSNSGSGGNSGDNGNTGNGGSSGSGGSGGKDGKK